MLYRNSALIMHLIELLLLTCQEITFIPGNYYSTYTRISWIPINIIPVLIMKSIFTQLFFLVGVVGRGRIFMVRRKLL
jgi:hypothetical protein